MLALSTLKYLASQKFKDAITLFDNGRHGGAIYLMGYALELSLKRQIGLTLDFVNGFPESAAELKLYAKEVNNFNDIVAGVKLTQIRQIKNHDLKALLYFSGFQGIVTKFYHTEWASVKNWTPEDRYRRRHLSRRRAAGFIFGAKTLLNQIF